MQRVIHVEWDETAQAFTGVPESWRGFLPQSVITPLTVPGLTRTVSSNSGSGSGGGGAASASSKSSSKSNSRKAINSASIVTRVSIKEFLRQLGFVDLNREYDPHLLRESLLFKLAMAPGGGMLVRLPFVIKLLTLKYLDAKSLVAVCTTCSEMLPMLDNRNLWKPLVQDKNHSQRTLFSSVSHDWRHTFIAMTQLDKDPKLFDMLFNVVVIGDRRVGKSRLVRSLAQSANQAREARHMIRADDPVVDAVSGIYRLGIDFVTRRVVIDASVVKLQVWDGLALGAGGAIPFTSTHVVAVVFDVTQRSSFDALPDLIHDTRLQLKQANSGNALILIFGNVTDAPEKRLVTFKEAKRYANERGMIYLEANCNDHTSVDLAFAQLAVSSCNGMECNGMQWNARLVSPDVRFWSRRVRG